MEEDNNPIANLLSDKTDRYDIEELNTSDITLSLKKGWQYIGNPFTCPINMESFLNTIFSATDDWKVVVRDDVGQLGVKNKYFVMAGGFGSLDNWTPDRFIINPSWLVGQKIGSTISKFTIFHNYTITCNVSL